VQSAGKKQRGSFNSLLLLEAHELSMHEVRPWGGEGRGGECLVFSEGSERRGGSVGIQVLQYNACVGGFEG
jgi:hypothetical protein